MQNITGGMSRVLDSLGQVVEQKFAGIQGGVQGRIRNWMYQSGAPAITFNMKDNRWCERIGSAHRSNGVYYTGELGLCLGSLQFWYSLPFAAQVPRSCMALSVSASMSNSDMHPINKQGPYMGVVCTSSIPLSYPGDIQLCLVLRCGTRQTLHEAATGTGTYCALALCSTPA